MIYTNEKTHGGDFKKQFVSRLNAADDLTVAAGYFGTKLVEDLTHKLTAVANRGRCRLLFGMVFHGGLSPDQKKALVTLDSNLRQASGRQGSGVFISVKPYHGKIYQIDDAIFLGSSNFSVEGFKTRWEATSALTDPSVKTATRKYLDFLFSQKTTVDLGQVKLNKKQRTAPQKPSRFLKDYEFHQPLPGPVVGSIDIKLRVDVQPASSLNLYFEPGRKTSRTGLYQPRPWYEVEVTTSAADRRDPLFPPTAPVPGSKSRKGSFYAYITEKGQIYRVRMEICSDGGKALMTSRESGGRETLGRYIKGKLEAAGVLQHGELITSDTLAAYGRDYITLRKIDNRNYILEF
jgi:hypothetical protein